MNATEILRRDHRTIEALLARYRRAGPSSARRSLFLKLKRAWGDHVRLEEEIFYPAVRGGPSPEAAASLDSFLDGHLRTASALEELSGMRAEGRAYGLLVERLRLNLERHFREVERGLFVEARRRLSERGLRDLGSLMAGRRAVAGCASSLWWRRRASA